MATQADIINHLVSKIWGTLPNPSSAEGQAALETLNTRIIPFSKSIIYNPTLVLAAKTVNNVATDQDAWWSLWTGVQPYWGHGKDYYDSLINQYNQQTGRKESWKEQSGVAAGRRPTILTSGRGAQGAPAMALTKLKTQLGK